MNMDNRWEKLNEQLKLDKVPKFTQIRLESSNICGYNCFMCPQKKMTRQTGTMSMDDLNYVLDCFDYIKYELGMHVHGFGEALLCEDLPERFKLITTRKPNFAPNIITTLGYKKSKRWLESLFVNGLAKVFVSLYGYDRETYRSVHGVDRFDLVKENLEFIACLKNQYRFDLIVQLDAFGEKYPFPKGYTSKKLHKIKADFTKYLHGLGITEIIGERLHNFGDGFDNLSKTTKTVPCSACWGNRRQHISILWNLDVCPCCCDYNGSVFWGNLRNNTLEEIYQSPQRLSFIKSLLGIGGGGLL